MIEYKIGEIFNYDLLDMEFKEMNNPMRCTFCFFEYSSSCRKFACSSSERSDNRTGYYKKSKNFHKSNINNHSSIKI